MNELYPRQFGGVPERFKAEGVKGADNTLLKIGDSVVATRNMKDLVRKGGVHTITDIVIEPRGNTRGFSKELQLEGFVSERFNPQRFKLKSSI